MERTRLNTLGSKKWGEGEVPTTDPCLPSLNLPAVPSPTTRCRPRLFGLVSQPRLTARVASYPYPGPGRLGLRLSLAGSPPQLAESSSLAYGPAVRLRLLSTSPRGDAVTFDYRGQVQPRAGTFTPRVQSAHRRTRVRSPSGPLNPLISLRMTVTSARRPYLT